MTSEVVGDPGRAARAVAHIERYLGMVADEWARDPARAQSRDFFVDWELQTLPEVFVATGAIALGDTELYPAHEVMVGQFRWNDDESQPELVLECDEMRQQWLLHLGPEGVAFVEQPPQIFDGAEIAYGERLEFIYDLLAWCGREQPYWRVREMGREQYNQAVDGIADAYPERTVQLMRRMPMRNVAKLIAGASQDMADDELSNQLTLPLDGSYSASVGTSAGGQGLPPVVLRRDTPAATLANLRFLQRVVAAVAEFDEAVSVPLEKAEVLGQYGNRWCLRVPLEQAGGNLEEGQRLQVLAPGDRRPCGRLVIDVRERRSLIATIEWDGAPAFEPAGLARAGLFAEPPKSPHRYVYDQVEGLHNIFLRTGTLPSPALTAALGIAEIAVPGVRPEPSDLDRLDDAQALAWRAAIQDERPLALIQGPPGTGKTHVLEQVLRSLTAEGKRVLVVASSHGAVDNVCRRVKDLPLLRLGRSAERFGPDLVGHWEGNREAIPGFLEKRKAQGGSIYAGTPLGVLRAPLVEAEFEQKGAFDVLVVDEAGMSPVTEFLLCAQLVRRVVLFGDHQQLPPFPLTAEVEDFVQSGGAALAEQWLMVRRSALEWLTEARGLPVTMLRTSYRCHNPRLMRFSSVLFYDAAVRASPTAEYFQLSWEARQEAYSAATLRFYDTSQLEPRHRFEQLLLGDGRPGLENRLEAAFCCGLVYRLLRRIPLTEISVIAPYRKQVRLIRRMLSPEKARATAETSFTADEWQQFLHERVATVDSFQGNESDAVIICYVRSNADGNVGFVDDPNRINVAHSRCRRELHVIGDLETLRRGDRGNTFVRLERTIRRDGEFIPLTNELAENLLARCKS